MKFKILGLCAATLGMAASMLVAPSTRVVDAADSNAGPGDATTNLSKNTEVGKGAYFTTANDKNTATAKSTAEFTVKPGTLQLVAVPDLNFGAIDADNVINGGVVKLVDGQVTEDPGSSKNTTAFDGNSTQQILINDLRGSGKGWQLNLSMGSTFKTKGDAPDEISGLSMRITDVTGADQYTNPVEMSGQGIGDDAVLVSEAGPGTGIGLTMYSLKNGTIELKFPPNASDGVFSKDAYQSDLTWTLVAAQ